MAAEWQTVRLADVGEWLSGGTPSKGTPGYWGGGIPWVTPKDMKVFNLTQTEDTLTEAGLADGSRAVEANTVMVVVRGMILAHSVPVGITDRRMGFNQDIKAVRCNAEVDPRFLAHWLAAQEQQLLCKVTDTTHGTKRLDFRHFLQHRFSRPAVSEQRAIAAVLDAADAAIGRARDAVTAARRLKRGLVQQAFERGRRDWPTLAGRQLFVARGGFAPSAVAFCRSGQRPEAWFMKVEDFNTPANRRRITTTQLGFAPRENPKVDTLPVGSLVIAKRGAAVDKNRVRVTAVPVALDPNLMGLCLQPKLDSEFFRHQLEWRKLSRYSETSGIPQLNNKDLYPRPFLAPDLATQRRATELFSAAEAHEDCLGDRIEQLERLKRGLMQVLLTGQVRVPPGVVRRE